MSTTTIPSTDEERSRRNTFCCCSLDSAAIFSPLYGIISTLLLPLTVQVIGGQYGTLVLSGRKSSQELLTLTDMPVALEVFLISLLFIGHLIGFISVIKKWMVGLVFYFFFRVGELYLCFFWFASVGNEFIKSHLMSQYSLGWYCIFALVMEFICISSVLLFCCESLHGENKKSDEESPSTMIG
ncbi:uncharacterized protein LOC122854007 [Aphidius gifuensis]|uniref:uncharacterized protein LOC122854007 n=1 Tax=Aphidius gifuensis TaxID=684658 RepID=UPI001CDD0669|nr:uncharacterized protein LOC122854007 [Aphidius gifuensis]